MKRSERAGVLVPEILLPREGVDLRRWAVVACDQYTSQPDYWNGIEREVGDAPSALRMILPECFLGTPGEPARVREAGRTMEEYVRGGILAPAGPGFVLVTRTAGGKTRHGLVMALDLERYDFRPGSTSMIRASERTIVERIPPRLAIRRDALLELPHILVLIDDPERTVIEPLLAEQDRFPALYDTELMGNGGSLKGRLVDRKDDVDAVLRALEALADPDAFEKKYPGKAPFLFAMGDGNHSFATAKTHWENLKQTLSPAEREDHPARWALVEVENLHDEGIVFEPIHRAVFGMDEGSAETLRGILAAQNGLCAVLSGDVPEDGAGGHLLPFLLGGGKRWYHVPEPAARIPVGTLQNALAELVRVRPDLRIDYIHGEDALLELAKQDGTCAFPLPAMEKRDLWPTMVYEGVLPVKAFSMGEANEKRYYMEARIIKR